MPALVGVYKVTLAVRGYRVSDNALTREDEQTYTLTVRER